MWYFVYRLEEEKQETRRVEHDFEDFQENSRQLEKELETALDSSEKSNREKEALCNRLQLENERIRVWFVANIF